ncbi:uncharacterized protein EKO05_0003549 [Ascochyta rabiei]|uniref:Oxidoreductase n=1 Tax=Didymella rabiei TaxID=5454 RepID=A0A163AB24_DIDRA|nr:uncharacterized protein EKO05_0003549 [Ascochyta rabiei]KZM21089.1 oxidoreductase [Ascochyta rabiei]UPX13020.1 hypothetical protein EKO05_0003549 [Ascochyta rabiei]
MYHYQFIHTIAAKVNTVVVTARNITDLREKVKADKISNTHVVEADLVSADSLKAAAAATSSLVNGKIDHLLINGTYLSSTSGLNPTDFAEQPEIFLEELRKSDEANVAGPLFAINAFLPLTIAPWVASSVPYSASKAAGNIVITKFAAELKDGGFIFLSISSGAVVTETLMTAAANFTDAEKGKLQRMFGRMMQNHPEWKGPVASEESVKRILKVVRDFKVEQSGRFISYWGNNTEWL